MNKKKSFGEEYFYKKRIRAANESSIVGIILGFILLLTGAYKALCTIGILCVLCKVVAFSGFVLIILGGFFSPLLEKPVAAMRKLLSVFGSVILKVLIAPVYLFMIIIGIFNRKSYSNKFLFRSWENQCDTETTLFDFRKTVYNRKKYVLFDLISRMITLFALYKMYIVIPVVIILFALGLIIFFASSNAVFSFVYTLF